MRRVLVLLAVAGGVAGAVAACDLNPQPLPPVVEDDGPGTGSRGPEEPTENGDRPGAAPEPSDEFDADAGLGDAGDASTDAEPDGG